MKEGLLVWSCGDTVVRYSFSDIHAEEETLLALLSLGVSLLCSDGSCLISH